MRPALLAAALALSGCSLFQPSDPVEHLSNQARDLYTAYVKEPARFYQHENSDLRDFTEAYRSLPASQRAEVASWFAAASLRPELVYASLAGSCNVQPISSRDDGYVLIGSVNMTYGSPTVAYDFLQAAGEQAHHHAEALAAVQQEITLAYQLLAGLPSSRAQQAAWHHGAAIALLSRAEEATSERAKALDSFYTQARRELNYIHKIPGDYFVQGSGDAAAAVAFWLLLCRASGAEGLHAREPVLDVLTASRDDIRHFSEDAFRAKYLGDEMSAAELAAEAQLLGRMTEGRLDGTGRAAARGFLVDHLLTKLSNPTAPSLLDLALVPETSGLFSHAELRGFDYLHVEGGYPPLVIGIRPGRETPEHLPELVQELSRAFAAAPDTFLETYEPEIGLVKEAYRSLSSKERTAVDQRVTENGIGRMVQLLQEEP